MRPIATPPEIPLRQLHTICGERIEYRKCPVPSTAEVRPEEIVKGYPYQPDEYVATHGKRNLPRCSRPMRRRFKWSIFSTPPASI